MTRRSNTALALARALHRYAKVEEPAEVFEAVCLDWPHRIAVLVNDYLFYEVDHADTDRIIAIMERDLNRLRTFRTAYPFLKKRAVRGRAARHA